MTTVDLERHTNTHMHPYTQHTHTHNKKQDAKQQCMKVIHNDTHTHAQ